MQYSKILLIKLTTKVEKKKDDIKVTTIAQIIGRVLQRTFWSKIINHTYWYQRKDHSIPTGTHVT